MTVQRNYLIANWVLFGLFAFLLGWFVISELESGSILINEAIAMFLFCLSFPLKIYNIKVGQYWILLALMILLFSPLSYSYTLTEGDISVTHGEAKFTSLISPVTFLILMLFLAFNYSTMINLYHLLARGSEKERNEESLKMIDFYHKKFGDCSDVELVDIFKMYNDYPVEAQLALKRIKEEKGIS